MIDNYFLKHMFGKGGGVISGEESSKLSEKIKAAGSMEAVKNMMSLSDRGMRNEDTLETLPKGRIQDDLLYCLVDFTTLLSSLFSFLEY